MKKFLLILILLIITSSVFANERFIPLELFTGGEIRNDTEIKYTPADKIFGEKRRKKIIGPQDWKNPFNASVKQRPSGSQNHPEKKWLRSDNV